VSVQAFELAPTVDLTPAMMRLDLDVPAGLGASLLEKDPSTWQPIVSMFGVCVVMWLFRTTLEGMGGVGGYTDQRFFAARSEREAGLLTLESIILSLFRWTMVAGLVVMGYHLVQTGAHGAEQINADAENVLPVVLGQFLPAGVRGLVIAGLIAAAMSTFDSTLNAGAAYIVKDLYQGFIKPNATNKELMKMSRNATVGLCVAGVALAAIVPNINQIWGLVTMGIGAGMFVPQFLRWYWPRYNGYGFAIGTAAGVVGALVFNAALSWPLYYSFPAVIGSALLGSVVATYATKPVSMDVLVSFWLRINPWGAWGHVADEARRRGEAKRETLLERLVENLYDLVALCFALPFQVCLLLAGMTFIFHDWKKFAFFSIGTVFSSIGLYFFWYRNLKSDEECAADDAIWSPKKPVSDDEDEDAEPEAAPAE
jgi:hypothetical protein